MRKNRMIDITALIILLNLSLFVTFTAASITSSAQAYWTFDSFDSSYILSDASGNGYNAQIVRSSNLTGTFSPTVTAGFVDNAFYCGGSEQYGYFAKVDTSPVPNGPFTITTWIKPTMGQWITRLFYYKVSWNNRAGFDVMLSSTSLSLNRYYNYTNYPLTADLPLSVGYWSFITLVWDGSYWKMYMNGRLVASDNTSNLAYQAPYAGTDLVLGGYSAATNNTYVGLMDQTRVWQSALTPEQIVEVMLEDLPD